MLLVVDRNSEGKYPDNEGMVQMFDEIFPTYEENMGFYRDHYHHTGIWAAGQGFEPQFPLPESGVLPLHHPAQNL